jgi:hypothetical protein
MRRVIRLRTVAIIGAMSDRPEPVPSGAANAVVGDVPGAVFQAGKITGGVHVDRPVRPVVASRCRSGAVPPGAAFEELLADQVRGPGYSVSTG